LFFKIALISAIYLRRYRRELSIDVAEHESILKNWECLLTRLPHLKFLGSCHKRQKTQAPTPKAPTPQEPIRNRQTRKVANAKGLNRNTNLT